MIDVRAVLVAAGDAEALAAWDELVPWTITLIDMAEDDWPVTARGTKTALRNAGALAPITKE